MDRPARARVVVLYTHPLLGEGLVSLLASEAAVDAVAVASDDELGRAAALHDRPELVIVEEPLAPRSFEAAGSMPVVFVRLSENADADGERLADPDAIVALARSLRAPAVVGTTRPTGR
jgi:hypothetical protein